VLNNSGKEKRDSEQCETTLIIQ